jgi:hypothetical protein
LFVLIVMGFTYVIGVVACAGMRRMTAIAMLNPRRRGALLVRLWRG